MNTYNVALHANADSPPQFVPVKGQEVAYPELPDVRLFVHCAILPNGKPGKRAYLVSEYITGSRVTNNPEPTPEAAIEAFRQHIATYPAVVHSFPLGIRNYLARYTPANE